MFEVKVKNGSEVYIVCKVHTRPNKEIYFLVFEPKEEKWFWILADNTIPVCKPEFNT